MSFELGYRERKYLILVILATLIFRAWGVFDNFFNFNFAGLIGMSAIVGSAGAWVWLQFWRNKT